MASLLETRSVIRFTGPETVKFLQGLVTNDVQRLEDPQPEDRTYLTTTNAPFVSVPPIYAVLLTPQERFLYDLFLYRHLGLTRSLIGLVLDPAWTRVSWNCLLMLMPLNWMSSCKHCKRIA